MTRHAISVLITCLLALLLTSTVGAHATIERAVPGPGATLQNPPEELVLEFSEELDPTFSSVELRNSNHEVVDPGPGTVDPAAPGTLRLALPDLPKDSYTAIYRVR